MKIIADGLQFLQTIGGSEHIRVIIYLSIARLIHACLAGSSAAQVVVSAARESNSRMATKREHYVPVGWGHLIICGHVPVGWGSRQSGEHM